MASIVITGTSRGLGLELVNQFLTLPASEIGTIFATARASEPSAELSKAIDSSNGRVHFVSLDVTSEPSVTHAAQEIGQNLGAKGLDILINNAGITLMETPPSQMKSDDLERLFSTNVTSVHRVTAAFLPHLEKGQQKKIANITSTLGSIAMVKVFGMSPTPSYKISKTALNMLTVQYAEELGPKGFTVMAVTPGWLKTDLGGPYAHLEPKQGASQVVKIILEAQSERDNGAFKDVKIEGSDIYKGENPPW